MKVRQLMTKAASCCLPDDTANAAARIMWERDCGFVPVVESGESPRVVGVVTDRDICIAAYTKNRPLDQIRLRELMSTDLRTCRATDDVSDAEQTMQNAQVHRLPVVEDAGQLLGVFSLADVAQEAAREFGAKRQEVTAREIGETIAAISRPREIAAVSA
ncbi:MAG TPA: CBS domain-containing protein [Myxococcota bacterium]|nr:CBS domain-containing protein [Myxococcota bacterium]